MFTLLGINHQTAPLAKRESVAFQPERVPSALQQALADNALDGIVVLSTCNRTELYVDCQTDSCEMLSWLCRFHGITESALSGCTYQLQGESAIVHLMRVASGLDSLVLGEPQILGQLKSAYAVAMSSGTLSSTLDQVFQYTFGAAKRVRSETAIGENPVSVAFAAVTLAKQIFSDLAKKSALLIGAGETIELVARHLKEQGIQNITIANRTLQRADQLASALGAKAILLSEIPDHLPRTDILVSSTASQLPVLGKGAVESALKRRKHRMMFMIDLAVPRDIEAEVAALDDVYLYSVDDLKEVVEENLKSREQAANEAQQIVLEAAQNWTSSQTSLQHVDLIKHYRQQAESARAEELQKALKMLEAGQPADAVMRRLSNNLTNKLIHTPTVEMNRVIRADNPQHLAWLKELLGLSPR